ncbi:TetR/AcrR family transcriptional regulator [Amycolatopsis balhimycina DSM 5908]|uniref:TetR/AcrR family transcriptional regulator n=1 Tax=Amycolatopsis balhimycina DSM 5908 TaxID=1081091 RepID=A0A428WYT8_AMYBA|nr:TetR/AcrR family transcriptional regulator [Amycolatopsis balhimycina]RSM48219.1 TetR/AcrR family transcriptional regulator [Amycolatopsis balhimycina DSM 5908]
MRTGSSRIVREDARQNRQRVLDAAREVFTRRGLDVPMATIARRAGVGVATLYRHFPNRQALLTAVFERQLAECASVVDEALADPDPWRAFRTAVEKLGALQAAGHELTAAFAAALPGAFDLGAERHEAERKLAELVSRAKATGRLRADFRVEDLVLLLKAVSGVATSTAEAAAGSRRLVAYLLQSFETATDRPLPPPARFPGYPGP